MDNLKTILTLIAIILGALAVLATIGFIYTFLGYLLILGVVCLGGYIAFRILTKADTKQISAPDPKKEFERVQRLLDEYKRKS
jgi:4-hydroxybenzoate polyprenyltransferase